MARKRSRDRPGKGEADNDDPRRRHRPQPNGSGQDRPKALNVVGFHKPRFDEVGDVPRQYPVRDRVCNNQQRDAGEQARVDAVMRQQRLGHLTRPYQHAALDPGPDRHGEPGERRPEERASSYAQSAAFRNQADPPLPAERRIVADEREVLTIHLSRGSAPNPGSVAARGPQPPRSLPRGRALRAAVVRQQERHCRHQRRTTV